MTGTHEDPHHTTTIERSMDEKRRIYDNFLRLHARKAAVSTEPVAHLMFYSTTMPVDQPLLRLDRDDVLDALDPSSELVRWLLEQMRTYDCTRQRIVGLVFDRKTVLSDVLRCPSDL